MHAMVKRTHEEVSKEKEGRLKNVRIKTDDEKDVHRTSPAQVFSKKAIRPHGKDAKLIQSVAERDSQGSLSTAKAGERKTPGKKAVFRPILASPFAVDWPPLNPADGSAIFHTLLDLLRIEDVQKLLQRTNEKVPRASARKTKEKNERRKARLLLATLYEHGIEPTLIAKAEAKGLPEKDEGKKSKVNGKTVICGLNNVTRVLEGHVADRVHGTDRTRSDEDAASKTRDHRPSTIFVCHADVSPPALLAHLPMLVATYNALCDGKAKLIRLPPNSEAGLADCVQLRRCSVLSLDLDAMSGSANEHVRSSINVLSDLLDRCHVSELRMAWLEQAARYVQTRTEAHEEDLPEASIDLLQPRIKHVRTSVPADLNSAKALKKARRGERKQKRKAHIASMAKKRK